MEGSVNISKCAKLKTKFTEGNARNFTINFAFFWLCWRHKMSGKSYDFMWAHADYYSLHHQRTRGHKTIGSHLNRRARKIPEVKMQRKIVQTGNKPSTKHLLLSRNFAQWPILIFRMHVTSSMPIQIEEFGGKLLSGIFCNSKDCFFRYNLR